MPTSRPPQRSSLWAPRRWALLWRVGKALKLIVPFWRDCILGRYRPWPWKALLLSLATVGYVLWPIDLIPDVIPFWGLTDDVVISGWLLSRLYVAMQPWREWRTHQNI